MIAYDAGFPEFVDTLGADGGPSWLADVARLENAWVEAYHSKDFAAAALAELDAVDLPGARIALHPAARLLQLARPAASIWASFQDDAEPAAPPDRGEDVLVARPEADVSVRILPPGGLPQARR